MTASLRRVPDRAFEPLRRSFCTSAPRSASHRLQRAVLAAARYRGVPVDLDSFVLTDNPEVRLANADSFIVEWLYWFGERFGYEPATVTWWKVFCAGSNSVLELGSNIGYFIIQGARQGSIARYTAVEPHPGCAALCRRNVTLNGITNVEIIEAAAVAGFGCDRVELVLPGGRDHYLEAPCTGFVGVTDFHDATEDRSSYSSIAVPAVAVESLVDACPDLIKMDVEGQEHTLLAAMLDFLRTARPAIFLELLESTPHLRDLIVGELLPAGYRCFVPTMERLVPLREDEISAVSLYAEYGTRDVILSPSRPSEDHRLPR